MQSRLCVVIEAIKSIWFIWAAAVFAIAIGLIYPIVVTPPSGSSLDCCGALLYSWGMAACKIVLIGGYVIAGVALLFTIVEYLVEHEEITNG